MVLKSAFATTVLFLIISSTAGSSPLQSSLSSGLTPYVLIDQLSWDSVDGNCIGTVWHITPRGRAARGLIRIGKPATEHLLPLLNDPDRAVAAHLVLCDIWKAAGLCGITTSYPSGHGLEEFLVGKQLDLESLPEYKATEVIMEHRAGSLMWQSLGQGGRSVDQATLAPNRMKWCEYLKKRSFRLTDACT